MIYFSLLSVRSASATGAASSFTSATGAASAFEYSTGEASAY